MFDVTIKNALSTTHPEIVKKWDITRNLNFSINNVSLEINRNHTGNQLFYWKCKEANDHIYKATITQICNNQSCPMCKGDIIVESNNIVKTHPEIAQLLHPTKNKTLKRKIGYFKDNPKNDGSQILCWKCSKSSNHYYFSSLKEKISKGSEWCKICENSLAKLYPDMAHMYDPEDNYNISIYDLIESKYGGGWRWGVFGQNRYYKHITLKCKSHHSFSWTPIFKFDPHSQLITRNQPKKCTQCEIQKSVVAITSIYPLTSKFWHPTRNKPILANEIAYNSRQVYWWNCPKCNHSWEEETRKVSLINYTNDGRHFQHVNKKSRKTPCPKCHQKNNSIEVKFPKLAKEFHITKNKDVKLDQININYKNPIWWECSVNRKHIWKATIKQRVFISKQKLKNNKCPFCNGERLLLSESLIKTHPQLIKEWHTIKNKKLVPRIFNMDSKAIVWWKCSKYKSHNWRDPINKRVNGTNCPKCENKKIKNNLIHQKFNTKQIEKIHHLLSLKKWIPASQLYIKYSPTQADYKLIEQHFDEFKKEFEMLNNS